MARLDPVVTWRYLVFSACAVLIVPAAAEAQTTLTWTTPYGGAEGEAFDTLVAKYDKSHPEVDINIVRLNGGDDQLMAMFAAGKGPDVYSLPDVTIPYAVKRGLALDLTPLVKQENYDLTEFFPSILRSLTFDGGLYAMTPRWNAEVMYYNESMFNQEGLSTPDFSWDWDAMLVAAKKLTRTDVIGADAPRYGVSMSDWWAPAFSFIWENNGAIFSPDLSKTMIASPNTVEALQRIADLANVHEVAPSPTEFERLDVDPLELFSQGDAGMLLGYGGWAMEDLKGGVSNGFSWKVAALPKMQTHASFLHYDAFLVSAATKHPKEAWDFLKYLVSEEAQTAITVGHQLGIATRRSVATSTAMAAQSKEHNSLTPFLNTAPYLWANAKITTWNEAFDAIEPEFDALWEGKQSALEAAQNLQPKLQSVLEAGR